MNTSTPRTNNDNDNRKNEKGESYSSKFRISDGNAWLLGFAICVAFVLWFSWPTLLLMRDGGVKTTVSPETTKASQTLGYPPKGSVIEWTLITDGGAVGRAHFTVLGTVTRITTADHKPFAFPEGAHILGSTVGKGALGYQWEITAKNGDAITSWSLTGKSEEMGDPSQVGVVNASRSIPAGTKYTLTVER